MSAGGWGSGWRRRRPRPRPVSGCSCRRQTFLCGNRTRCRGRRREPGSAQPEAPTGAAPGEGLPPARGEPAWVQHLQLVRSRAAPPAPRLERGSRTGGGRGRTPRVTGPHRSARRPSRPLRFPRDPGSLRAPRRSLVPAPAPGMRRGLPLPGGAVAERRHPRSVPARLFAEKARPPTPSPQPPGPPGPHRRSEASTAGFS